MELINSLFGTITLKKIDHRIGFIAFKLLNNVYLYTTKDLFLIKYAMEKGLD